MNLLQLKFHRFHRISQGNLSVFGLGWVKIDRKKPIVKESLELKFKGNQSLKIFTCVQFLLWLNRPF